MVYDYERSNTVSKRKSIPGKRISPYDLDAVSDATFRSGPITGNGSKKRRVSPYDLDAVTQYLENARRQRS